MLVANRVPYRLVERKTELNLSAVLSSFGALAITENTTSTPSQLSSSSSSFSSSSSSSSVNTTTTTTNSISKTLLYNSSTKCTETMDWDAWFYAPGMPPVCLPDLLDTSLSTEANSLVQSFITACKSNDSLPSSLSTVKSFGSLQKETFLDMLIEEQSSLFSSLSTDKKSSMIEKFRALLAELDRVCDFSSVKNAEIRFRWLTVCVRAEMKSLFDAVRAFVSSQGRMKFTRPLYRDLARTVEGKKFAEETFAASKHLYHPICAKMIDKDLNSKA
eukprot:TRINITY_DN2845_c0_g1_i1.p1 TRINITY_DN2845_c0_g1~~TRINITY_DN2845_c0_g1_i1.p1  ORF type:complete len:274 (+),score=64.60 TRINITY_DN2845_c0_g1_i1:54-875(+)